MLQTSPTVSDSLFDKFSHGIVAEECLTCKIQIEDKGDATESDFIAIVCGLVEDNTSR